MRAVASGGIFGRKETLQSSLAEISSDDVQLQSPSRTISFATIFVVQLWNAPLHTVVDMKQNWAPSRQFGGASSSLSPISCHPVPNQGVNLLLDSRRNAAIVIRGRIQRPRSHALSKNGAQRSRKDNMRVDCADRDRYRGEFGSCVLMTASTSTTDDRKVCQITQRYV